MSTRYAAYFCFMYFLGLGLFFCFLFFVFFYFAMLLHIFPNERPTFLRPLQRVSVFGYIVCICSAFPKCCTVVDK